MSKVIAPRAQASSRVQKGPSRSGFGKVKLYEARPAKPPKSERRERGINSLRLGHLQALIRLRYPDPVAMPEAEAERFLRLAIAQMIGREMKGGKRTEAMGWAAAHVPILTQRPPSWFDDLETRVSKNPRRYLSNDQLAKHLGITIHEERMLREVSGYACLTSLERLKEVREREARERQRDRGRKSRAAKGATPHAQSAARLKPWKLMGVGRSAYYDLPKEERDAMLDLARKEAEEPAGQIRAPQSRSDVLYDSEPVRSERSERVSASWPRSPVVIERDPPLSPSLARLAGAMMPNSRPLCSWLLFGRPDQAELDASGGVSSAAGGALSLPRLFLAFPEKGLVYFP